MSTTKAVKWKSRAVIRDIAPGSSEQCAHCSEKIRFSARDRARQVICNVYKSNRWLRKEHFHAACYLAAGQPYGAAETSIDARQVNKAAAVLRAKELAAQHARDAQMSAAM